MIEIYLLFRHYFFLLVIKQHVNNFSTAEIITTQVFIAELPTGLLCNKTTKVKKRFDDTYVCITFI